MMENPEPSNLRILWWCIVTIFIGSLMVSKLFVGGGHRWTDYERDDPDYMYIYDDQGM